jgi:hypothetical protein
VELRSRWLAAHLQKLLHQSPSALLAALQTWQLCGKLAKSDELDDVSAPRWKNMLVKMVSFRRERAAQQHLPLRSGID